MDCKGSYGREDLYHFVERPNFIKLTIDCVVVPHANLNAVRAAIILEFLINLEREMADLQVVTKMV